MERKNTQVVLVSAMILVMAAEIAMAAEIVGFSDPGKCIRACENECRTFENYNECYNECITGCGSKSGSTLSYYCKLGCSLHECSKVAHDAKLQASCLEDCSNVKCKV